MPTAAHFIYIPGVLLVGIVIGWILGSRAAADAYAAEARRDANNRKRIDSTVRQAGTASAALIYRPSASRWARTSGKPGREILACAVGDVVGDALITSAFALSVSSMPKAAARSPSRG